MRLTSTKLMNAYPTLHRIISTCKACMNESHNDSLAVVGKIDAKVHKIVLSPTRLINDSFKHGLIYLVGNVAKHNLQETSQPDFGAICWMSLP